MATRNKPARRKPATSAVERKQAARKRAAKPAATRRAPEALPSWSDLAKANERAPKQARSSGFVERIPTGRFALALLAVVLLGTLYVHHVYATQDALAALQAERRANLDLHLTLTRLKGDFDRATGPAVVYQRARALGLEEAIDYGPTIQTE